MRSMTGFGSAAATTVDGRITVEVRGVNHRYLDVHVRLPREMAAAETGIREAVRKGARRGRVDVTVWWIPARDPAVAVLDAEHLRPIQEVLERAVRDLGLSDAVTLDAILRARDAATTAVQPIDEKRCRALVRKPLEEALAGFDGMRRTEGASLVVDARKLLTSLEKHVARIAKAAPRIVAEHGRKLTARVRDLLDGEPVSPERMTQEIALLAERMDVREELTRLGSHVQQARGILDAGREGGRKLDFLVQEMLRETNTIGSKLAGRAATREVVAMKAAIEKLREQIQNLE